MASVEPVLQARGLRCRRGGRDVLDGVDLSLFAGQTCGLLGPNGAGKTTLLRLLVGAERGAGSIELAGERIDGEPLYRRARRGLAYLPQHSSVLGGLSVEDNVRAVLELHGVRSKERGRSLLETFGLQERAGQRASTLSGGERRRLELARVLAQQPRVVLLDEPFTGLDPKAVAELATQLAKLEQASCAVLLAEHRVEQALTICQRACILIAGRVATSGSAAEVVEHPAARQAFFGPVVEASRSMPWH